MEELVPSRDLHVSHNAGSAFMTVLWYEYVPQALFVQGLSAILALTVDWLRSSLLRRLG